MIKPSLLALLVLTAAGPVFADSGSTFTPTDNGAISVKPNLADPAHPTYVVSLNAQSSSGPQDLILRCQNDQTEAYVVTNGVFGSDGMLLARWKGMAKAGWTASSESSDGTAAFVSNPIPFILRLVREGSVILQTQGYDAGGAARYELDSKLTSAVYELAKDCEWQSKLPPMPKVASDKTASTDPNLATETSTVKAMLPEIKSMGKDRFLKILNTLMP